MERLRIAVQKSGRLFEDSIQMLKECNIQVDEGKDLLRVQSKNFPADILFLRNSDIPQYLEDGVAHVGIIGENLIAESAKDLEIAEKLGFSKCRLSIAVPKNSTYDGLSWLQGRRIATSYPHTLQSFLAKHNLQADLHVISGSVEIAPNIGLADAICDLVSSGNTLFQNGLEEKEILLKSEAVLAVNRHLTTELRAILDKLLFRIRAVLNAKSNKYILLNAPNDKLDEIIRILPGMKSPTLVPLALSGWSSVHTVIQEDKFWEIIHELKDKGAQGILVIPIEKMVL